MRYRYRIIMNDGEEIIHTSRYELNYHSETLIKARPWVNIEKLGERGHPEPTKIWINLDFATSIEEL